MKLDDSVNHKEKEGCCHNPGEEVTRLFDEIIEAWSNTPEIRRSIKKEKGKHTYSLVCAKVPTPTAPTDGVSSRIAEQLSHVLFMDYDSVNLNIVEEDALAIQALWECGDFYVFQTREHGFHVVCLDHFTVQEIQSIHMNSNCDRAYRKGPLYNFHRGWVLRTSAKGDQPKPEFLEILESPFEGYRLQSCFHAEILRENYGLKIELENPDNQMIGYVEKYKACVKEVED